MDETRKDEALNKILEARTPRVNNISYLGGFARALKRQQSGCRYATPCASVYSGSCCGPDICDIPDKQGWR